MSEVDVDVERHAQVTPSPAADLIGRLLSPLTSITAVCLAVAWRTTDPLQAVGYAAVLVFFCALAPYAFFHWLAHRGSVDDAHLLRRNQRMIPVAFMVVSVVIGVTVMWALDAPRALVLLVGVMFGALCAMGLITVVHKVSFHTGVATGAAGMIHTSATPWWATGLLLAAVTAVCWARIRAGRHTPGQVALGIVVGTISAWAFWALA